MELESCRVQLEEESEARLDIERQLVRMTAEATQYKSKYESEATARTEEVEEIRRKFTIRIQESEEHIETLMVKVNALEKQKSRLQSEIEVLIIDLEKVSIYKNNQTPTLFCSKEAKRSFFGTTARWCQG